jgi:hypothetical protein
MNIEITPNDYKEVQECREEYVQYIVDAFLQPLVWGEFRPNKEGRHMPTRYVMIREGKGYGFAGDENCAITNRCELIYKCEVMLAIKLLIQSGYYLYRWYDYGGYTAYRFDKSPRRTDKERIDHIRENDWSHLFL